MPVRIIGPMIFLGVIVFCLFSLFSGSVASLSLMALIPLGFLSLGRPDLLFMAICWTYNSTLRVPGIPGQVQLYQLLIVAFVAVIVLRGLMSGRGFRFAVPHWWAVAFAGVLAVTMFFRGTGFRVLGEGLWGGARYIDILLAMFFFLTAGSVRLSERQWKWAIIGLLLSGAVPALAELVYVFSGGAVYGQYYVLLPRGGTGAALRSATAGGLTRFTMLSKLSHVYLLPFIFWSSRRTLRPAHIFFLGLGFLFGGFTGHRIVLLYMLLFVWVFLFFQSRRKVAFVCLSSVLAAVGLFAMGQVAFLLPQSFQRMLTLVPLANVSYDVMLDASGTIEWRMLLWKRAIQLIPSYLWIGKGYAYSPTLAQALDVRMLPNYAIWWALVQSAYHQGILSLLIGMGIPGLVTGLTLLATLCMRHYRFAQTQASEGFMERAQFTFFIVVLVHAVSFTVIYGDVFVSFPSIFLYAAIAESLRYSLETRETETHDEAYTQSAPIRGIRPVIP